MELTYGRWVRWATRLALGLLVAGFAIYVFGLREQGDHLGYLGIVLLCVATIAAYARIVPLLLRARERLLAALAAAQIAVLLVAASGFLN